MDVIQCITTIIFGDIFLIAFSLKSGFGWSPQETRCADVKKRYCVAISIAFTDLVVSKFRTKSSKHRGIIFSATCI